jgi:hypothetical protein
MGRGNTFGDGARIPQMPGELVLGYQLMAGALDLQAAACIGHWTPLDGLIHG